MRLIDADGIIAEIEKNKLMAREPEVKRCIEIIRNATTYIEPKMPARDSWIPVSEQLPESEKEVEVTIERRRVDNTKLHFTCRAIYEDGKMRQEDSVYNWDEFENCECEEDSDNWLVPEGWFEAVSYMEEFAVIDDFVIAWRELSEPYKAE